jgi:lipoprotein-releasing system ATP-binding protein
MKFSSGALTGKSPVGTVRDAMASSPPPAETRPTAQGGGAHLTVRELWKVFEHGGRRIEVLRGVDLDLPPGALVSIVGASGVGKSTLLHLLGTLDVPTSGSIAFDGVNVTALAPGPLATFRNQAIGFVFQFHHLLPEFTALENAMMPGLIARLPRKECMDKACRMLERVGLSERLHHRPGELSGGEQQRVALARALLLSPRLLLGDEPTGNLDSRTGQDMHNLFFELNRELGMTLLLVTHNNELAGRAYRKLRMIDGRVVEET